MSDDKKKEQEKQEKGFIKKHEVDPKTAKKNIDKWLKTLKGK